MDKADNFSYKAFISYSHNDEKLAKWLMRALETYKIPKHLVGKPSSQGIVPQKLPPLFRDRDELSVSSDLGAVVRKALSEAEFLIVICSPSAASSQWVNQEIKEFIKLNGRDKILCVISSGEPVTPDKPDSCFPAALFDGLGEGEVYEPAAADLRPEKDGKRSAKLKLVATLLAIDLSDLIQRDAVRRQKNILAIAGASLMAMVAAGYLAIAANIARDLAETRRNQAENLIEFMLTDLKAELQPVGRLDALDAVGEKVLEYYALQDLEKLSDDALGRRARSFHMLGEVERNQGNTERARDLFINAMGSTETLLERNANDQQRIFDHAQSVYWVGSMNRSLGDYKEAEVHWLEYEKLAQELVRSNPDNVNWQMEVVYAASNMGILYLRNMNRPLEARENFEKGLSILQQINPQLPDTGATVVTVADAHAWLADALMYSGHLNEVRYHREAQTQLYDNWLVDHPDDYFILRRQLAGQLALSIVEMNAGAVIQALERKLQNIKNAEQLVLRDPENMNWQRQAGFIYSNMMKVQFIANDVEGTRLTLSKLLNIESMLQQRDMLTGSTKAVVKFDAILMRAKIAHHEGDLEKAKRIVSTLLDELSAYNDIDNHTVAYGVFISSQMLLARIEGALGNGRAREHWHKVILELEERGENLPIWHIHSLAVAYEGVGRIEEASHLTRELLERGFAHPNFIKFCQTKLRPLTQDMSCMIE